MSNITCEKIHSVDALWIENENYYASFKKRPFFSMIQSGLLNRDDKKRESFFNYVQIFSDFFQTMIHMRQATCRDEKFYTTFLSHFTEELGHNQLLRQRQTLKESWDPVIVAVCTWFVYQMQSLDNIEKAVVMHWVVEKTGDFYHEVGNNTIGHHVDSNYFAIHAEQDCDHADMISDLIIGYPDFVYARLTILLNESWAMMITMVDRVHELVMRAE